MAFKIYTKTGDRGETSLYGGMRLPKHHIRIEAYGTVDELNSYVGLVRDCLEQSDLRDFLKKIQDTLFDLGANLASDPSKNMNVPAIETSDVEALEKAIDEMQANLPELKFFILPGGHTTVSFCHIARCVCRRAERLAVALQTQEPVPPLVIQYLNRLSDYLFVLARKIAQLHGAEEVAWRPRK